MAKKKKAVPPSQEVLLQDVLKELQTIRALLLLMIVKIGGSSVEIAAALDLSKQRVSQLIPASKIAKLDFGGAAAE